MDTALVVGGTRFVGRHAVEDLLANGYEVTLFNRGQSPNPFADREGVAHVAGDRADDDALRAAAESVAPDVVVDCYAYHPGEVEAATEIFADAEAYVYVSSASAYEGREIPLREDETALYDCTPEQATDDATETYGPRKAEGDRVVARAAERGVRAMSVRPVLVYGPHDYTERLDYWIDRVRRFDRVVVPGDGDSVLHRAFAPDVGSALRVVAEEGRAGEAYNVADRRAATLSETVDLVADALDASVEQVYASARDLDSVGLSGEDYFFYAPYPLVADTAKLHALGWESTPVEEAMARTVEEHLDSDRDGSEWDPGRDAEEQLLERLAE